jgi:hypothetical protein
MYGVFWQGEWMRVLDFTLGSAGLDHFVYHVSATITPLNSDESAELRVAACGGEWLMTADALASNTARGKLGA